MMHARGSTMLEIKVKPGSKRPGVSREGERLVVAVAARAVEGAANEGALNALAEALGIAPSRLEIVRGHRGRLKTIAVSGFAPEELHARVASIAAAN